MAYVYICNVLHTSFLGTASSSHGQGQNPGEAGGLREEGAGGERPARNAKGFHRGHPLDLPGENGDLPSENGDLPSENGDLPGENGDLPGENGDFWWIYPWGFT